MIREALGRLWETLGDSGGSFGEALGGFGELWETLGESLGRLWEALGKLWEPFRAFLLLAPSLPPLYIKKIKLPTTALAAPYYSNILIWAAKAVDREFIYFLYIGEEEKA